MPFHGSARLIVGTGHYRLLISGNINSDATGIDITLLIRRGGLRLCSSNFKRLLANSRRVLPLTHGTEHFRLLLVVNRYMVN